LKILVDTSVWSLLLVRKKPVSHPASKILAEKIAEGAPISLTGIIYQEIIQGVRSETQQQRLKKYLLDFDFLEPTPAIHQQAAQLFIQCRGGGLSVHTIDVLIAVLALHFDCALLTTDNDFSLISGIVPLRLISLS
jgi:predicted nucleic acid-binding protein